MFVFDIWLSNHSKRLAVSPTLNQANIPTLKTSQSD